MAENLKNPSRQGSGSAAQHGDQFVALAAHDLRTPMRNVRLLAEMLRESLSGQSEDQLHLLDLLSDVAGKTDRMIGDILDYAQTANRAPDPSAFHLGALCGALTEILDPLGQHRISWPDVHVETDQLVLQIALRNLLDNALKHGGKASLNVRISLVAEASGTLAFEIADDGVGFQSPATAFLATGVARPDSGYGLMGIHRLIQARGGRIHLLDQHEKNGACVAITLPGRIVQEPVGTSQLAHSDSR